jgi:hypothetical protein
MPTSLNTREGDNVNEDLLQVLSGLEVTVTHGSDHLGKQCSLCNYCFSAGQGLLLLHTAKHRYRLCMDCRREGDLHLKQVRADTLIKANRCIDDGLAQTAKGEMFLAWSSFGGAIGWLLQAKADACDILPVARRLVQVYALRGDSKPDSPERILRDLLGLWELTLREDEQGPVVEVLKLLRATYDLDGRHADAALIEARLARIAKAVRW